MRKCVATIVALMAIALWVPAAWAEGSGKLFGGAETVKVGAKPTKFAVELISDLSNDDASDDYSGIAFSLKKRTTFADIRQLSTSYSLIEGTLGGGSPRFQIGIDLDGDGNRDGNVFVYIGTPPAFADAAQGWQDTGNLIDSEDARYDLTQLGGPFYGTYEDALALVGDQDVTGVELVVDAGWAMPDGVQSLLVDNVRVNNDKLSVNKK